MTNIVSSSSHAEPAPYRWRWLVLAVVMVAEIMDLLDSTITGIAAPSIVRDIGGGDTEIQWIAAAYTLTFAVGLVTGGRLGDAFGRRRMFILGASGFGLTSALCAVAGSPGQLVAFRALQGAFGALMIPQALGMVKAVFPERELPTAFGLWGPVLGLSAVAGPVLGGVLVSADLFGTGWRLIFLINLPLAVLAVAGALRFMPESRSPERVRIDLAGMAIVSIALLALVYPLVEGRDHGWPTWMFVLMGVSVVLIAAFAWFERRLERDGRSPLVTPSVFRKRAFSAGLAVGLAFFAGLGGLLLVLSLFLQVGLGFSPSHAGVTLIPLSLGLAVGAALSGIVLTARFGRHVLHGGLVVMALGAGALELALRTADQPMSAWALTPGLVVLGIGCGTMIATFFSIVLAGVEDHELGSASGTLNATQQLGSAVGVAVLGTIFFSVADHHVAAGPATALTTATETVLWVLIGTIGLAFALVFLLPLEGRSEEELMRAELAAA
jgi:EmrB/QacA subfamily drug resistance transporter